ncbi:hypothetical protein OIE66_09765 [Nonomuraea sp. NBC_01738]|uniref:hypothetical protein n=1 Tax=Nonomuraea sp. NBC_01738 TaxID=2976003 RepID=UPI002E11F56D|nr:hypothetical protein OIE66_09765 [Nonomuraea sp. NBC_01738]
MDVTPETVCPHLDVTLVLDAQTETGPQIFCRDCRMIVQHFEEYGDCPHTATHLDGKDGIEWCLACKEILYEDFSDLADSPEPILLPPPGPLARLIRRLRR